MRVSLVPYLSSGCGVWATQRQRWNPSGGGRTALSERRALSASRYCLTLSPFRPRKNVCSDQRLFDESLSSSRA